MLLPVLWSTRGKRGCEVSASATATNGKKANANVYIVKLVSTQSCRRMGKLSRRDRCLTEDMRSQAICREFHKRIHCYVEKKQSTKLKLAETKETDYYLIEESRGVKYTRRTCGVESGPW